MKNEDAFNAYLSKEMRRNIPKIKLLRSSDKFNTGIPDFLLWANGTSVGIESKLVHNWPARETTKILKHTFQGVQQTFLESLEKTKNKGFGMVAQDELKLIYIFRCKFIPKSGNWTLAKFKAFAKSDDCEIFTYSDTDDILKYLFDRRIQ